MTFEGVHKSIETVESENFYVIQLQLLPLVGQFLRLKFDFKFLQSCTQTKELYVQIPGLRHAYFKDFSIDNAIYAGQDMEVYMFDQFDLGFSCSVEWDGHILLNWSLFLQDKS